MHTNRHSPQSEGGAFVGLDWDLGRNPAKQALIPAARRAGWYARGVGGAAAGGVNRIPAARPAGNRSVVRAGGINPDKTLTRWQGGKPVPPAPQFHAGRVGRAGRWGTIMKIRRIGL